MNYGTIIVNSETGKAIDLIDSRECDDIVDTLSAFQGVSFVTRDRARGYTKAISKALPEAQQIADKFHLSKNLSDAIHEHIKSQYKQIRQNYLDSHKSEDTEPKQVIEPKSNNITPRMQLLFDSIQQLIDKGLSIRAIARNLKVSRKSVKKYRTMPTPEPRHRPCRNNYEKYHVTIEEGMQNKLTRQAMFNDMQKNEYYFGRIYYLIKIR